FGCFAGITDVYPLKDAGFERLISTDIGVSSLLPDGIEPAFACQVPQHSFYIGTVIDIRRLNHPDWIEVLPGQSIRALSRHVARFLAPLRWYPGDPEDRLVPEDGQRLPRFCAFAREGSSGAKHLWRAGFRAVRLSRDGEYKYVLDLEEWNTGGFDPIRR